MRACLDIVPYTPNEFANSDGGEDEISDDEKLFVDNKIAQDKEGDIACKMSWKGAWLSGVFDMGRYNHDN